MNRKSIGLLTPLSFGAAVAVAALILVRSIPVAEAEVITDPRQWCDDATRLLADKSVVELIDKLANDSNGWSEKSLVAEHMAGLGPILTRAGRLVSHDFLAERRYGDVLVRLWYLLVFEKGAMYFRCEVIKFKDHWTPDGFRFESEPEKIGLP
jgi:hypothetical protein